MAIAGAPPSELFLLCVDAPSFFVDDASGGTGAAVAGTGAAVAALSVTGLSTAGGFPMVAGAGAGVAGGVAHLSVAQSSPGVFSTFQAAGSGAGPAAAFSSTQASLVATLLSGSGGLPPPVAATLLSRLRRRYNCVTTAAWKIAVEIHRGNSPWNGALPHQTPNSCFFQH